MSSILLNFDCFEYFSHLFWQERSKTKLLVWKQRNLHTNVHNGEICVGGSQETASSAFPISCHLTLSRFLQGPGKAKVVEEMPRKDKAAPPPLPCPCACQPLSFPHRRWQSSSFLRPAWPCSFGLIGGPLARELRALHEEECAQPSDSNRERVGPQVRLVGKFYDFPPLR